MHHSLLLPRAIGSLVVLALAACSSSSDTPDADAANEADAVDSRDVPPDVPDVDATPDDAPVPDVEVAVEDAPTPDVSDAEDVEAEAESPDGEVADGTGDAPLDTPADGPSCNPALETPSPGGMCDGRGIIACRNWAEENGGPTASAVCIMTTVGAEGCARATTCTDTGDPSTCRCGSDPACVPGEVCVTPPGGAPACICIAG